MSDGDLLVGTATEGEQVAFDVPIDVMAFCQQHAITDYLDAAMRFARSCFDLAALGFSVREDEESGQQWIAVRAGVRGTPSDVLAAKKQYTAQWVAAVPWPQRHQIRLSFDII